MTYLVNKQSSNRTKLSSTRLHGLLGMYWLTRAKEERESVIASVL